MPYRRLPNTDQARLRALQAARTMFEQTPTAELKYSIKLALEAQAFAPIFEQAVVRHTEIRQRQSELSATLGEASKSARLYLSHFIQVFNMCIARGEIKPELREMLSLPVESSSLPDISTDQLLLEWGNKVVAGEENRTARGLGNRIYNPSIAVVKVRLEKFTEIYNQHRDLLGAIDKQREKLEELRAKADELILAIWNSLEENCSNLSQEEKINIGQQYGIVYFYRSFEKSKEFL